MTTFDETSPAAAALRSLPLTTDEWRVLTTSRPNTLLEGLPAATEEVVQALVHADMSRAQNWMRSLPPSDGSSVTLIVRGADALNASEQQALLGWIETAPPGARVIATSALPLFSLVRRGLFSADLYYRLNVFRIVA